MAEELTRNDILAEIAVLRQYLDKFANQEKDEALQEVEDHYYELLDMLSEPRFMK